MPSVVCQENQLDRPRRIRIVAGIGVGLVALFVACLGAPMVAMLSWPSPDVSGDPNSMIQSFSQASQAAAMMNRVSFDALLFAGLCLVFVLTDIAIWFVGPSEPDTNSGS